MAVLPAGLVRVPNALASQVMLGGLTRTQTSLVRLQEQLATGQAINRPSDNPVGASAVAVLDDLLERRDQRLRNLSHADAVLGHVDTALADITDLLIEAKGIGSSQVGIGSDAATRENQAHVVSALLDELFNVANRKYQDLHLFGGDATARQPFVGQGGFYAYLGEGDGLATDLGATVPLPITLPGHDAFGALSGRVQGQRDLDPGMVLDTRLVDLGGAQDLGVRLGTVNVDINGTDHELDLTGADTVGDVADALAALLNAEAPGALGANGVRVDPATGNRFEIDLNPGFTVTISDLGGNATAADLGLDVAPFQDGLNETGADLDPRLTEMTPIGSIAGLTLPLGSVRLENGARAVDVDLSGAQNVRDLMNLVEGAGLGVRVEIADAGDRLNFVNELSGARLSVGETAGGSTATELGVRSLASWTRLDEFNDGRGVQILAGNVDPATGLPDPARDLDFRVSVKDGRSFDVDLAGAETVQDVLDAINAAAAGVGLGVPAEFEAHLADEGNGIALTDATVGPGGAGTIVESLNGSFAAEDLGLLDATQGASLVGEDRARVAVDGVFAHLIALRDALLGDDTRGITLATGKLEADIERAARARADVGVRARRVLRQTEREEERSIQDQSLRSAVRDLDFAEAATRFALLQQQLQAALSGTAQAQSLTLLDFLR